MRVARAVRVDRLDVRRRDMDHVLISGIRCCPGGAHEVCALGSCAHENGTIQLSEHPSSRFARLESPVANARISAPVSDLLSLPVVHRDDDVVRGQPLRDPDDGRDIQEDVHTLGEGAQRRLCGLAVRGVVHE